MSEQFDIVVVGGRPAGAMLAHHLGRAGIRTMVVDRACFPSYPAVSTPFLLPHGMALLDEVGLAPEDYAPGAPWLDEVVLEFGPHFDVRLPLAEYAGRRRFLVLDRQDFDDCLWSSLGQYDCVTRRDGFTVTGLLRDDAGVICGVRGRSAGADEEHIPARGVIGADGRFSRVARDVQARVVHRRDDVSTHVYYAFWEGVAPWSDGDPVAHIHSSLDGWSAVFMPMSRGRVAVLVQSQSALFEAEAGRPSEIYLRALQARPAAWRRLEAARRVSAVRGFKRLGNLFREAAGPGWALVGDAWLQKDSIDAQGIYDALISARMLGRALVPWHRGDVDWRTATAAYADEATGHMRPMFDATMERLKREVYSIPPPFVAKTILRWLLTDAEYKRRFGEVLVRRRDPDRFVTPGLMLGALSRGLLRSLLPPWGAGSSTG